MTAALVAILSMIVLGLPVALTIDRRSSGPLLLGGAFLYGSGTIFLLLLALSIVHVRWTVVTVTVVALVVWLLGCWVARLLGSPLPQQPRNPVPQQPKPHWLDIATLVSVVGFALYATIAPLWEWDFWAIWGLKARVFLEHGGIDWPFLQSRLVIRPTLFHGFVHPDYPLLVPLNFDFVTLLNGGWSDRWLGALSVAWAAALLLIVRSLAAEEASVVPAALVTLTLTGLACSRYVGLAEGPLIAFSAAGVLFVRRGLQSDDPAAWRHAAVLLGFGANTKNEGLALLVSVVVALLLVRARAIIRLWPAAAIAAPWLILRAVHDLKTDIAGGSVIGRVLYRLPYTGEIIVFLSRWLYEPWFWTALLIGVLIAPAAARRRELFVFVVTAVQLAFYVGSYYATPLDARWHVVTSWSRLTDQIAIPITFVVVLMLAKFAAGVEDSPHAQARPVER